MVNLIMEEDVGRVDEAETVHLKFKDGDQSLKPENREMLELREVHVQEQVSFPDTSFDDLIPEILQGKYENYLDHQTQVPPCPSPLSTSNVGDVVEELMVKSFDESNMAIVGPSNYGERLESIHSQFKNEEETCKATQNPGKMPISSEQCEANEYLMNEGIKTKIFSQSGFSQFIVKPTLKGKGIMFKDPSPNLCITASGSTSNHMITSNDLEKASSVSFLAVHEDSPGTACSNTIAALRGCEGESEGLTLREWINSERPKVDKAECFYIFRQIVDLVDYSHSQGAVFCGLRPSLFRIFKENKIKHMGTSLVQEFFDNNTKKEMKSPLVRKRRRQRAIEMDLPSIPVKKMKFSDHASSSQWPIFHRAFSPFNSIAEQLEEKWYSSPEELQSGISSTSSNVYSLGILLFELLYPFDSEKAREAAMSDISHRILPRKFLSDNLKQAGFCLWLLHPEPSCRPTTREIMQSEALNGRQDLYDEGFYSYIKQKETESELLLSFLLDFQELNETRAGVLTGEIGCLEADIEEIGKRRSLSTEEVSNAPELKLMKKMDLLENTYFSARTHAHRPEVDNETRADGDLLRNSLETIETPHSGDRVGAFFDGLSKYAQYNRLEIRGELRTGEPHSTANLICSMSFDRDEDYFAVAGVSKKIKVYEFNSLLADSDDFHYPSVEMLNRSRISCVCWNSYIKNYVASSDYDGIVKLWDVTKGQTISPFIEHRKRAWSVDFSQLCPTQLASGSDDCSVKLWNVMEVCSSLTLEEYKTCI